MKPPPEKSRSYLPTMIDRAVFPGLQGGPHNHQTAAIAVALKEAAEPSFKEYATQIVKNAKTLADELMQRGFELVTGGTDNHLLLVNLTNKNVFGAQAEKALDKAGITVNKNTIPNDPRKPYDPSGIRLGTPSLTSRGMKEGEMRHVAEWIDRAIASVDDDARLAAIRSEVKALTDQFPLYPGLTYLQSK
jgi:glycine hydroxymethyltransferase